MKTLVIPDIHNKVKIAQKILDGEPADKIVLLGDYFDDFGDGTGCYYQRIKRWWGIA